MLWIGHSSEFSSKNFCSPLVDLVVEAIASAGSLGRGCYLEACCLSNRLTWFIGDRYLEVCCWGDRLCCWRFIEGSHSNSSEILEIGFQYLEERDRCVWQKAIASGNGMVWLPELKRSLLVQQIVDMERLLKLFSGRRSLEAEGRYESVLIQLYRLDELMDEYAQYDTRNSRFE